MPRAAPLLTTFLLLTGCGIAPAPDAVDGTMGDRMEWQGVQACADCAGIETHLVLAHDEASRRYRLTETFHTGSGGEPFVETGVWQLQDALVLLEGDEGSARAYGVLADGRLQSRGADGHAAVRGGHVLLPVSGE